MNLIAKLRLWCYALRGIQGPGSEMLLEVLRDAGVFVVRICTTLVRVCAVWQLSVRSVPRVGSLSEIHDPLNGSF